MEGVVVNFAQIGSDFFVHLDLDGNDEGDVWVKIIEPIVDMQGEALDNDDIEIGMKLKVMEYTQNEAGFIEAHKVVLVSDAAPDEGNPRSDLATTVNVFARTVGAPRPELDLFGTDRDAWICQGEEVQLYWVVSPDVTQVSLGETLGVFDVDHQGGTMGGLNWGTVMAQPFESIGFQVETVDGTFDAIGQATVYVFGDPANSGPFQTLDEGNITAELVGGSTEPGRDDDWQATLSSDRFSQRLSVSDIRTGRNASDLGARWRIRKEDLDGGTHAFSISGNAFQHPFRPEGTDITLPLIGEWRFTTDAEVTERTVVFRVRTSCA